MAISFYNENPAERAFGASGATGHHTFGMNRKFSTPIDHYKGGLHKTAEVDAGIAVGRGPGESERVFVKYL